MKYLLLLCDGMSDYPIDSLGGKTPMEAADKPCMNKLAEKAKIGLVKNVADGLSPGSDVANLTALGYDPKIYYSGRSPLEAASIGIELSENDIASRANLVTLSDHENYSDKIMLDYCGGDISTEDADVLIKYLHENLCDEEFDLYTGVFYRHCLVWKNGDDPMTTTPPHDISDKVVGDYLPKNEKFLNLMKKSYDLLKDHPVNLRRVKEGHKPANSIWIWGSGHKKPLSPFKEKYGVEGAMISAVDLLKGIAKLSDMKNYNVENATGYIDTNFAGKTQACIQAFDDGADFVYLHIEAPDECGHRGELENKIKAIEIIDKVVLSNVKEYLDQYDDYKIIIMPDHPTPVSLKTHTSDPVPFLVYHKLGELNSGFDMFSEAVAKKANLLVEDGHNLLKSII